VLLRPQWQYFLQLLLGASLTLAFAPFNHWWVVFVAIPAWLYLILTNSILSVESPTAQTSVSNTKTLQIGSFGLSRFKLTFAFSLGYFGVGLSWVHVSIADFGGLPLVGSIGLMLLLCGYLALFPATLVYLLDRFIKIDAWPIFLPLGWLIIEWLRARLLTGFPWLSIGYSQLHGPLVGYFPLIGEIGVSALVVCICIMIALGFLKKSFIPATLLMLVIGISSLVLNQTKWTETSGEIVSVSMIQGNIAQSLRWTPEQDLPTMRKYLDMSEAHWDSDIVIWPEAAIPQLEPIATEFLRMLDQIATESESALITGIVNYQFESQKIYNNLLALGFDQKDANTIPYRYMHNNRFAKHHLLPIGEFVPFENVLRDLAPIFDLPMSSFTRGDFKQSNLTAKGYLLAPAICFEIAFPSQIAANLYTNTAAIITVSNDAWFGNSHGPHQHLQIAQVRAKEFGLPVLRSTNNGVTAFIDHHGIIMSSAPQFEDAVLSADIQLTNGITPYREYGDLPIWLFFITLAVSSYISNRRLLTIKRTQ